MKNYVEWKSEHGEIMVQVFSVGALLDVQKMYIDRGYYIKETALGIYNSYFFTVGNAEEY